MLHLAHSKWGTTASEVAPVMHDILEVEKNTLCG